MSARQLIRVKLVVEYDGTDFRGWQLQPGRRTVQGEMETAARRLCSRRVSMTGSGRTDAGVHAVGQVVHADIFEEELGRFERGFSPTLPQDVSVLSVEKVPSDFHARFSAVSRLYRYRIARREHPLTSRFEYVLDRSLNTAQMRLAARSSVGAASWRAMAKEGGSNSGWDVEVLDADVFEDTLGWTFLIQSNRFLRGMVRLWVGTLVGIGTGHAEPGLIRRLLETGEREFAGPSLPARGLTLLKVRYP
jgi:tRNA pseudouridine38-40 synthase